MAHPEVGGLFQQGKIVCQLNCSNLLLPTLSISQMFHMGLSEWIYIKGFPNHMLMLKSLRNLIFQHVLLTQWSELESARQQDVDPGHAVNYLVSQDRESDAIQPWHNLATISPNETQSIHSRYNCLYYLVNSSVSSPRGVIK